MATQPPARGPTRDSPDGRGAFAIALLVSATATITAGALVLWGPGAGLIAFGLIALVLGLALAWQ